MTSGTLARPDGHHLYWEVHGSPAGLPVMVLHGGPGGGSRPGFVDLFDPARWRIILYDQRACGRSTPHAADLPELLGGLTMETQIADLWALADHLGIAACHLFGGSWGATLALAAALEDRDRVRGLILGPVTTTAAAEIDWLYGGLARFLPEAFTAFAAPFPDIAPGLPLVNAYAEALVGPDGPLLAQRWARWEQAAVALDPAHTPSTRWDDARFTLGFARQCAHVFRDLAGMPDRHILNNLGRLSGLPVELVHSRFDLSCPPDTAFAVRAGLDDARLTLLPGGLHSATEGAMSRALREASDRMCADAESRA